MNTIDDGRMGGCNIPRPPRISNEIHGEIDWKAAYACRMAAAEGRATLKFKVTPIAANQQDANPKSGGAKPGRNAGASWPAGWQAA
jgi:hypothetical protein